MLTSDIFQQTKQNPQTSHRSLFEEQVSDLIGKTVSYFRHITRNYAIFNVTFFVLGLGELLGLILFFPFFAKTSLVAFSLAALFLTGFAYFILRFYLEAKKPEQFVQLKKEFVEACQEMLSYGEKEDHLQLTHIVYRLLEHLEGQEYQYYEASRYFKSLQPLLGKFSLWCHWHDVHQMKELLHFYCIQQRIEWIKLEPTNAEAHASLAKAYEALYKLYIDPRRLGKKTPYTFIMKEYLSSAMLEKFEKAAERALEEFKILDAYIPQDPWIHSQMAAIYHDLQMPDYEITEYETLRLIVPADKEILFKLGVLYFQQGRNAQGLRLYEELRKSKDPQASALIHFYDAYSQQQFSLSSQ
jgi:hypothetical protein